MAGTSIEHFVGTRVATERSYADKLKETVIARDALGKRGVFISVHGIDGTGKTSLVKRLHDELERSGVVTINYDEYGETILNPFRSSKESVREIASPDAQFFHAMGSMRHHASIIRELLEEGFTVLKSRDTDDVLAHFTHLGVAHTTEIATLSNPLESDCKIVLLAEEAERMRRVHARGNPTIDDIQPKVPGSRLHAMEHFFLKRAEQMQPPERGIVIDTSALTIEEITSDVLMSVRTVFPSLRGNMTADAAFNSARYVKSHTDAIRTKIQSSTGPVLIEIGGKPFGDFHASRVLPGYDPYAKAEIIRNIQTAALTALVVNAKDILLPPNGRTLHGRVRGDSGLTYDREVIRIIEEAKTLNIHIDATVLSVTPPCQTADDADRIASFRRALEKIGMPLHCFHEIPDYPHIADANALCDALDLNPSISARKNTIIALSPGGGSGKFGVLLSEMHKRLKNGEQPSYIKLETFPVFHLPTTHPLNLAFEAATADLGNAVQTVQDLKTNYDKDIENLPLLKMLYAHFHPDHPISKYSSPLDMGVNHVEQSITSNKAVTEACHREVLRRLKRYREEYHRGIERQSTVYAVQHILARFPSSSVHAPAP